jgi:hypothetical protein
MKRAATALVWALLVVAGWSRVAAAEPSRLIHPPPPQGAPLAFDHSRHHRLGLKCESCHPGATSSTAASGDLLPGPAACRNCHKFDGPRVRIPPPNLKFNHRLHASKAGCELCHAKISTGAPSTGMDLPMMATCLGCHDGKQATSRCGACHITLPDGRLKVDLARGDAAAIVAQGKLKPSGSLRGFDAHTPSFRNHHKQAGRDEGYCLSCHRRSECIDCHAGVVRPGDIHPSDYVTMHSIDARRNSPDCSSCHRNQTFCLGCHQRTGVGSDPEGGQPGRQPRNPFGTGTQVKRFHPPGWARDATGAVIATPGPASHGFQAKRNIRACVSCHRETTCLECHSTDPTRSASFNPHGPGFADSRKCRALAERNRRSCLKCHTAGAPELDCR